MLQTSCARCGVAGDDLSKAGRLFEGDDTQIASTVQPLVGLRFERQIMCVHALGERPLAELLIEIARSTNQFAIIAHHLEEFARLDAATVRALGADRFPPSVLGVVR